MGCRAGAPSDIPKALLWVRGEKVGRTGSSCKCQGELLCHAGSGSWLLSGVLRARWDTLCVPGSQSMDPVTQGCCSGPARLCAGGASRAGPFLAALSLRWDWQEFGCICFLALTAPWGCATRTSVLCWTEPLACASTVDSGGRFRGQDARPHRCGPTRGNQDPSPPTPGTHTRAGGSGGGAGRGAASPSSSSLFCSVLEAPEAHLPLRASKALFCF